MMRYVEGMIEVYEVSGEMLWMWGLMFLLPCIVVGVGLVLYGVRGRKAKGRVKCAGCGEVKLMEKDEANEGVCECGQDLKVKGGVVWERKRELKGVVCGIVVMLLPLLSWVGMTFWFAYEFEVKGDHLYTQAKYMTVKELMVELDKAGQWANMAMWGELQKRSIADELKEDEIAELVNFVSNQRKIGNLMYEFDRTLWEGYRHGKMSDEVVLQWRAAILDGDVALRVYDKNDKTMGMSVMLGLETDGMSKRLGYVRRVLLDGQEVEFVREGENNRGLICYGRVTLPEQWQWKKGKSYELKAEVEVMEIGVLDGVGIDHETKREDWPVGVLENEVIELELEI
ncbi:hypothetical protein JD969_07490 [Planctomycetota bacterium]|nr:hypothetical protein JD969_07490 [Planctomycetota bacterium]